MTTDQFDNYQLDPNTLGDDWVFSGDEVHLNRAPKGKISNPQYYFVGARYGADRTRTVFDFSDKGRTENPMKGYADHNWAIHDGYIGHGVDWSEFNYNPYGGRYDGLNPNFRVMNDWLWIMGMGSTDGLDKPAHDVMDRKESDADGMEMYKNYPTEGYSSFGKTTGGASPDKRWAWNGNTWVPA